MNTVKKQSWAALRLMCAALLCSTIFIACSESNDSDEPDNPDVPVSPVNPGDYKNIPVTGGTIENGEITIEFPAGTFDTDTKVAVTQVKKGEVAGDNEASPFFQLTLPMSTNKPFTVKMKADAQGGEAEFVVRSQGYAISLTKEITNEKAMETTYTGGKYTTTLPAFDGTDSKENTHVTIGLVKVPDENAAKTARRSKFSVIGKEGNISWELDINYWSEYSLDYKKLKEALPTVNLYIKEAVHTILELGFKIPDGTKLNYHLASTDYFFGLIKSYGYYSRGLLGRSHDGIYIKDQMVLNNQTDQLKQSIIHETLHNFQSYYEVHYYRNPIGVHMSMYEMGSVWIEKFMNRGELNGKWQMLEAGHFSTLKNHFRAGLSQSSSDITAMYGSYEQQGYALAPLLYYMISKNYARGYKDSTVVSLYDTFWGKVTTNDYTLIDVLDEWYNTTFKENFFKGTDNINDYYLKLWKGELMSDFNVQSIEGALDEAKVNIDMLNESNLSFHLDGEVYPYGCEGLAIKMNKNSFKDDYLKDKEMVIKQEAEGLKTYLLYNTGLVTTALYPKAAVKGDSICISGKELDDLRKNNRLGTTFFLLTLRNDSKLTDKGTIPSKESVQVRKVNNDMRMTNIKDFRFMCTLKVQDTKTGKQSKFSYSTSTFHESSITQNGTTVHIELTAKEQDQTTIYQWERSCSFDIINFSTDAFKDPYGHITSKVKNFSFAMHSRTDYPQDWSSQYKYEDIEISVSNMEPTPYDDNRPGFYYFGGEQDFVGKAFFNIDSFLHKEQSKDRNRDAVVKEYTIVNDPDNILSIDFTYDYVNVKE